MKRFAASLAIIALAACTPQQSATGPEAVVTAIYEPIAKSKGEAGTPIESIPMTTELRDLVNQAEAAAAGNEPVIDGDVAGNCQDCTGFADLKIGPTADDASATADHQIIEANFSLFGDQTRTVYWDMVRKAEGWQVDNIMSEGFNLRSITNTVIAAAAEPPTPASETTAPEATPPATTP